tara:strand:- start:3271 stop:4140 length:870 start_codon:yes stop_codon:yes gene_type:complete
MTTSNDHELQPLQHEAQRLLGRNLLMLQQYERQIKAIVAHQRLSGPSDALGEVRAAQIDGTARKTLGTLVGDLLGSYVVAGDVEALEDEGAGSSDSVNWIDMQMKPSLPDADFAQAAADLKELVHLRNNLVHHFIDQHDLWSSEGCRSAQSALIADYNRIRQNYERLREWAGDMDRMRQAMSEALQSKEVHDLIVNGVAPVDSANWHFAGVLGPLREALGAIAVDGWASVEEAGTWIEERYPEQLPAKYGCRRWRQVVHEAPKFELRYLNIDGKRSACYRDRESYAKTR